MHIKNIVPIAFTIPTLNFGDVAAKVTVLQVIFSSVSIQLKDRYEKNVTHYIVKFMFWEAETHR